MHRIGFGFDAHRFKEGRKLVIGGVEIPYSEGLIGHSDADVLTHAICDAILGRSDSGTSGATSLIQTLSIKTFQACACLRRPFRCWVLKL